MKKINIILLLIIVLALFLFSSCVRTAEATKYTKDLIRLESGDEVEGIILPDDESYGGEKYESTFTKIIVKDGSTKNISNEKIEYIKYADVIITTNKALRTVSIEKPGASGEITYTPKDGNEKKKIETQTVKKIVFDNYQGNQDEIHIKSDEILIGNIELDKLLIVNDANLEEEVDIKNVKELILRGDFKERKKSPIEQFEEIREKMGGQNVVTDEDNGWLYTVLGVLVVFAALTLMLIAFSLMKFISKPKKGDVTEPEKGEKERRAEAMQKKKDERLSPDIITAVCTVLMLSEEDEKTILTINRVKSKAENWSYAGRVQNSQRAEF